MAAGAWVAGKLGAGKEEPASLQSTAPAEEGATENKPILLGENSSKDKPDARQPDNSTPILARTYQVKNQPDIIYLAEADLQQRKLVSPQPNAMARPVRLALTGEKLYFLYQGQLLVLSLADLGNINALPRSLMPAERKLPSGERIREPVDLAAAPDGKSLLLLDKTNDLYRFFINQPLWAFAYKAAPSPKQPDPHFITLENWSGRTYLLDYARNQIWKQEGSSPPVAYFPKDVPSWLLKPGDHNVTEAVDMYIDGDVYVLTSQGQIHTYRGGKVLKQPLTDLNSMPSAGGAGMAPRALTGAGKSLFVTEAAQRRIIEIDKASGQYLRQFVLLAADPEFGRLHDATVKAGTLYALAGDRLAWFPLDTVGAEPRPEQIEVREHDWLGQSGMKNISPPVPGALLPDNFGLFPGARRLYRYGLHEGADFFDRHDPQNGGKYVKYDSPVAAIQAGTVIRADHSFKEMTPADYQQVLAQCQAAHETSRKNEDRFRGRQVWVQHPGGAVSVYAHLSGIADIDKGQAVKPGQMIGYVGNSGTSGGIQGDRSNPHLHLEIWLHDIDDPVKGEYLGKWLGLAETKELWEEVLD